MAAPLTEDVEFMHQALRLARRGYGRTSPNPMVGAILVKSGRIIGSGWHHRAGAPHAEIEALRAAERAGASPRDTTLYVTLEPCCTHGRTPPCTAALIAAGLHRVVAATPDPNPHHAGRGFTLLSSAGIRVDHGLLAAEAMRLNETFNHWIVHHTPFVTVKAALTLDGKIATAAGESKWITGTHARTHAMRLRRGADAILVGVNTVLADDPALTLRPGASAVGAPGGKTVRRLVLDSLARTPLSARLVSDAFADRTTIFVGPRAPARRVAALAQRVPVVTAPALTDGLDLRWILRRLGREQVVSLLIEGGGEVNASFLSRGLAQRVAFFYAPLILGERAARTAVAGTGFRGWTAIPRLRDLEWRRVGEDLFLTARVR